MKNLKKVLALAVAFVLCFTMFAGALLFTDVEPGKDYSEAITLLSDLGVISGLPDGSFGINIAITRADAACLIARLVTGETNPPKNFGNIVFTDVPTGSYYETSVAYCAALGITSGTGGGKFSPERTISDAEFIAMVTRALGYDTAEAPLSYPWGNITVAQAKGLLEGVNVDYQSAALRGEDAQILYNALFADYDKAAKNKNVYQHADDFYTVTLAEEVFNLGWLCHDDNPNPSDNTRDTDFRSTNVRIPRACEAHTWVIAGVDARSSENKYVAFAIDDDTEKVIDPDWGRDLEWSYVEFNYDGDVTPYLGYRVELWGEMIHTTRDANSGTASSIYDVVAIKTVEGQSAYAYNASEQYYDGDANGKLAQVVEGSTLYVTHKDSKNNTYMANINLDDNEWNTIAERKNEYAYNIATVYEDEDNVRSTADSINLNFLDGDQYTLIDWDSDNYIDFVVRTTYKYGEAVSVSKKSIVLSAADAKNHTTEGEYVLKLDDDNLKVQGAEGIEEDDIVEISVVSRYFDRNDGEVVTIALSKVDATPKTLEKLNLTKDEYTFDGTLTYVAEKDLFDLVEETDTLTELREKDNVGHQFDLYLDRNGFILKAVPNDDTARGYLMVLDTVDGTSNLNTNKNRGLAAIDVLFDDNTTADEVPVVKDLRIDDANDLSTGYRKSDRIWDQRLVVGNVYKYYMNDDGQITKLESKTDNQRADYSFDDSKDRIAIQNEQNENYTNYTFADDAVVFAARQINGSNNGNCIDVRRGYIQVGYLEAHPGDDIHGEYRYWVDPEDVVAVKVEDIPEIDNRLDSSTQVLKVKNGATVWNWDDEDVTHPAEFVSSIHSTDTAKAEYGTAAVNGRYYGFRAANDAYADGNDVQNAVKLVNSNKVTSDVQARALTDATYDFTRKGWISNTVEAGITYSVASQIAGTQRVPRVAYDLNTKGDIEVAVLGVDSLDYFNQSSVKLALITDVYAHGRDTYSIDAAIDGKVENFKTIEDDESDIFVGRFASYKDMQSYLDLDGEGARNGLYAEVTMNSDGLITKIRAMDIVENGDWYYDSLTRQVVTTYAEGNVYRVTRGVVSLIKSGSKSTQVTWQANPIAADNEKRLYQLSKSDDHNLGDELEAYFDEDTLFYRVDGRPIVHRDEKVTVDTGFGKVLETDKIKVETGDDLEKSDFVNTDKDDVADYAMADFVVRKSDTEKLVAVFRFKDTMTNIYRATVSGIASENIFVDNYSAYGAKGVEQTINVKSVGTTISSNLEVQLTNGTETARKLFTGYSADKSATIQNLKDNLCTLVQEKGWTNDVDVQLDGAVLKVSQKLKGGESTVEAVNRINVTIPTKDGFEFTKTTVAGILQASGKAATSIVTVSDKYFYSMDGYDYVITMQDTKNTAGALNKSVTIRLLRNKVYLASEIAEMIGSALGAVKDVDVTVKGNVVTVVDTTLKNSETMTLTITPAKSSGINPNP